MSPQTNPVISLALRRQLRVQARGLAIKSLLPHPTSGTLGEVSDDLTEKYYQQLLRDVKKEQAHD